MESLTVNNAQIQHVFIWPSLIFALTSKKFYIWQIWKICIYCLLMMIDVTTKYIYQTQARQTKKYKNYPIIAFWCHFAIFDSINNNCTSETMETKLIISSNNWLKKSELYWYKYLQISFIGRIFTKCPWWPWYVYYHWRYVFHHTAFPMDQTC